MIQRSAFPPGALLPLVVLVFLPVSGAAQQVVAEDDGLIVEARALTREQTLGSPLLDHDGVYVVVHLAENRVFILDGPEVVWSAPAGTGTGFRLSGQGHRWTFTTPRGLFTIRRKEKDPVWEAPDWYFVEKGIRIPPLDHPSRKIPGVMGSTAMYLGDGIAIHGTNSPGLLLNPDPERRRVSHGCIRLTNEDARDLFHQIDVGTPVLVF